MKRNSSRNSSGRLVFAHLTIGLQLAITILIFVYAGYRLDLHFNKSPIFLLIGVTFGMSIGFYHLMKDLSTENKKIDIDPEEEKKRIKWN
ncbi:MAG: AtpZ/AtpI family protein [Leptospirales bacterium]|nr:AtpZ/AtpI family protein [Leptospirales bacterium]